MNEELKPCPFCGGKAVIYVNDGVCAVCTERGATTPIYVDAYYNGNPTGGAVDRAIKQWNRRVNDGETDKAVKGDRVYD